MTMRKCKLATLAIAVLMQLHVGAGYLFGEADVMAQVPQAENLTRRRDFGTQKHSNVNGGTCRLELLGNSALRHGLE